MNRRDLLPTAGGAADAALAGEGRAKAAREQAKLIGEPAMWAFRIRDSLPTGPQSNKYRTQWAQPHDRYARHPKGQAPLASIS